jgi:hypothetical protein
MKAAVSSIRYLLVNLCRGSANAQPISKENATAHSEEQHECPVTTPRAPLLTETELMNAMMLLLHCAQILKHNGACTAAGTRPRLRGIVCPSACTRTSEARTNVVLSSTMG